MSTELAGLHTDQSQSHKVELGRRVSRSSTCLKVGRDSVLLSCAANIRTVRTLHTKDLHVLLFRGRRAPLEGGSCSSSTMIPYQPGVRWSHGLLPMLRRRSLVTSAPAWMASIAAFVEAVLLVWHAATASSIWMFL